MDAERKVCKGCGRSLPITKFQKCCDAYTGQEKWRRNVCYKCRYQRRLQRRLHQFTGAQAKA